MQTSSFWLAFALVLPAAETHGTVTGEVRSAATGEPIRRANITLQPDGMAGSAGTFTMPQAPPLAAATDAEGKFRIENVEPGKYRLYAARQR